MTTFDLIDCYLFDYVSTRHLMQAGKNSCGCESMVEEMNEIRNMYSSKPIQDVLRNCVCRRHGHQYCLKEIAIIEAVDALMKSIITSTGQPFIIKNKINENFSDFEELYDFIHSVIGNIKGIGPLTVYDTAKRIGHLFETPIYPKQYVYLAAGAADGAKNLLKVSSLKFREPIDIFKPYFGTLPSIFIEDILCIFKKELQTVSNQTLVPTVTYPNIRRISLVTITKNKTVLTI